MEEPVDRAGWPHRQAHTTRFYNDTANAPDLDRITLA
jgi:hypothetical protein